MKLKTRARVDTPPKVPAVVRQRTNKANIYKTVRASPTALGLVFDGAASLMQAHLNERTLSLCRRAWCDTETRCTRSIAVLFLTHTSVLCVFTA